MTMALYAPPAILVIRFYSPQEVRRSCGEWWRRGEGRYGWIRDGWVGGWRRVGVADEEEISERSG